MAKKVKQSKPRKSAKDKSEEQASSEAYQQDPLPVISPRSAVLRDGATLSLGDEVETSYNKCEGYIFVISDIKEDDNCESGFMVKAHLKGDPERPIKTKNDDGMDANWFKRIPS